MSPPYRFNVELSPLPPPTRWETIREATWTGVCFVFGGARMVGFACLAAIFIRETVRVLVK